MYEHGKLSAKEAALWTGRQAEVKKVRHRSEKLCMSKCESRGATWTWRLPRMLPAAST